MKKQLVEIIGFPNTVIVMVSPSAVSFCNNALIYLIMMIIIKNSNKSLFFINFIS